MDTRIRKTCLDSQKQISIDMIIAADIKNLVFNSLLLG